MYSREEYAKKEFWDDRFKETKGFFDWYANWKELRECFLTNLGEEAFSAAPYEQVLQVGCGNSLLSEHMAAQDGYVQMTNTDISNLVLEKMKGVNDNLHEKDEKKALLKNFQYMCMDSTRMPYRAGVFDLVVDKGTYDALACGFDGNSQPDKTMVRKLFQEMVRVTAKTGALMIITNGTPEKRLDDFNSFAEEMG